MMLIHEHDLHETCIFPIVLVQVDEVLKTVTELLVLLNIICQPQCAFRPLVGEGDSQTFGVCSAND